MLPKNPLLQLTAPRVRNTLDQIRESIWSTKGAVQLRFLGNGPDYIPPEQVRDRAGDKITPPFSWGKLFDHGWFALEFPAPVEEGDFLRWDDQGEGTLYIDGEPYAGFDTCHKEWPLPAGVQTAFMEGLCLQRGVWGGKQDGLDAQGSTLLTAEVVRRNEKAWKAFHDMESLFLLAHDEALRTGDRQGLQTGGAQYKSPIEKATVLLRRLLRALDDACNAWDASAAEGILAVTGPLFSSLCSECEGIKAVITGHAHIDLVWLWTEACGEYKAVHTFSSANRLMELYPEFHFGYSQSASYEAVQRRSPALMERVRERIGEKRWEPTGATYVESDTQIACGEALVRAFTVGHKAFQETVGTSSRVLWIPDVFGYCGCLPQIMKECGVDYFFTTKLTWNTITRFPHSSFRWQGIDGSEVITHITQACGYNNRLLPEDLREETLSYRQSDVHDEILIPSGYGDGGGGPAMEHCERQRRYASILGLPTTRWGRVDDFFRRLEAIRHELPAYQGELYFEYHRGIFTTHHRLKAAFRDLEAALREEEAVHAVLGKGPVGEHAWKRVLFAQFHDYIPGSSVWQVYAEGVPEMENLATNCRGRAVSALGRDNTTAPGRFNPLPLPLDFTEDGRSYRLPPLSGGMLSDLEVLPSGEFVAEKNRLGNDRVLATFDGQGRLSRLRIDKEEVALAGSAQIWSYPDNPHEYDCWDIDRQTLSLGKPLPDIASCRRSGVDAEGAFLRCEQTLGQGSHLVTTYRLRPGSPVLEVEHRIDWQEEKTLLKMVIPTAYAGTQARFGSPFGSVRRAQQAGDARAEAMFEVPASRWALVADDSEYRGLFVVTENTYGFTVRDGQLGISLLRAARLPWVDKDRELARELPASDFSDTGQSHTIRYALGHFRAELPREEMPAALAETLFTRPLRYNGRPLSSALLGLEGGPSLQPVWAQPAEDGFILRLHETLGRLGQCRVLLRDGASAARVRMDGRPLGAEDARDGFDSASGLLRFRGHRVYSLKIT
ncbi:MAG: alpha-mannosidase [Verrucomicrobia bacterium]|jgi:alpha-mannosidase|nr:alpha-mannosidase [Verrucomicrobiota bacterium]